MRLAARTVALLAAGALVLLCGAASAAVTYPDRMRDLRGGAGPDIVSVNVSATDAAVTFRVRFATAPPLRVSTRDGWVDMLLVGIDVPPLEPPPAPGGEWRAADFALGTHGPSRTGQLVRLGTALPRRVATIPVVTTRSTVSLSIPRRALGNPARFAFQVAAARELREDAAGDRVDFAPGRGVFRYAF